MKFLLAFEKIFKLDRRNSWRYFVWSYMAILNLKANGKKVYHKQKAASRRLCFLCKFLDRGNKCKEWEFTRNRLEESFGYLLWLTLSHHLRTKIQDWRESSRFYITLITTRTSFCIGELDVRTQTTGYYLKESCGLRIQKCFQEVVQFKRFLRVTKKNQDIRQ